MEQNAGALMGGVIGLLIVAVIGLVIGALAKLAMPGKDPGGWFVTILLGIAGSWVGSWIWGLLGLGPNTGLIGAVVGAVLILAVYRLIRK